MASSSGTKRKGTPPRSHLKKMSRAQSMLLDLPNDDNSAVDSELLPTSLAPIIPILRVANDIEKENPRVAYLCRFHAFEKAHRMDPTSSGRGVRQFKTYLLHNLEMMVSMGRGRFGTDFQLMFKILKALLFLGFMPLFRKLGFWGSIIELARAYKYIPGLILFMPIAILSWFPFVSEFQTSLLCNKAFSRGLQSSMILAGRKDKTATK